MEATMSVRTSKKPGIDDSVAARRKHKDCFLDEIDRFIDGKPLGKVLHQKLKRVANAVGNLRKSRKDLFSDLKDARCRGIATGTGALPRTLPGRCPGPAGGMIPPDPSTVFVRLA
jgi:hypothetical protein